MHVATLAIRSVADWAVMARFGVVPNTYNGGSRDIESLRLSPAAKPALPPATLACLVYRLRTSYLETLLAGYRFFSVREDLVIRETLTSTALGGLLVPGTTFQLEDQFETHNEFHGGDIGFAYTTDHGCWHLELLAKIAMGRVYRTIDIDGGTIITAPGFSPSTRVGGLLAQPTNIGHYTDSHFAVLPEFGLTLSCRLGSRLWGTFGYSFLFLNDVARPGN